MAEYGSIAANAASKSIGVSVPTVVLDRLRGTARRFAMVAIAAIVAAFAVTSVSYQVFALDLGTQVAAFAEDAANTAEFTANAGEYSQFAMRYDYAQLNASQQAAYNKVYRAAFLQRSSVTLDGLSGEEAAAVLQAVCNDSPELFFVDAVSPVTVAETKTMATHVTSTIDFSYRFDEGELAAVRADYERMVDEACSIAMSNQAEANRVSAICSWMNSHVARGTNTGSGANAQDALVTGQATDAAYAQLFCALCRNAGIDCRAVAGDGQPYGNVVLLGGDWRPVDAQHGVMSGHLA